MIFFFFFLTPRKLYGEQQFRKLLDGFATPSSAQAPREMAAMTQSYEDLPARSARLVGSAPTPPSGERCPGRAGDGTRGRQARDAPPAAPPPPSRPALSEHWGLLPPIPPSTSPSTTRAAWVPPPAPSLAGFCAVASPQRRPGGWPWSPPAFGRQPGHVRPLLGGGRGS